MKKSILILATATFLTGALFLTSCNSPSEKVANAEDNVTEAQRDLDRAQSEYLADMETYRTETAAKIEANNQSIIAFNNRLQADKKEAKAEYKEKIAALEQKNAEMKKRLDDYSADGKDNWETFKIEFSRDMDELGKALSDLTVNNVK